MWGVNLIGVLSGLCFTVSGFGAAATSLRFGKTSVPKSAATLVFFGTVFGYAYLFLTYGWNLILGLSNIFEAVTWGIILWFAVFPRRQRPPSTMIFPDDIY